MRVVKNLKLITFEHEARLIQDWSSAREARAPQGCCND